MATTPPIRAAYWNSNGFFPASDIQKSGSIFTHIYYAFLQPRPDTFQLIITVDDEAKLSTFKDSLGTLNPLVKTLLSIGGGENNNKVFSEMARTPVNREAFIRSSIQIARKYRFDGVDLDWEYPENSQDMSNLGLLYEEWRKALAQEASNSGRPRLLLTSAVYYAWTIEIYAEPNRSYPAHKIQENVDWVNLMCYDYYGTWAKFTAAPAALHGPAINNINRNTDHGITSWINAGVQANKLVMGLPLFGKCWTLENPTNNRIGATAVGVKDDNGDKIYSSIVEWNTQNNARVEYDEDRVACYSYSGSDWIGYDDARCVEEKVKFAQSLKLAGYFFWALGQDTNEWTLSRQAYDAWN